MKPVREGKVGCRGQVECLGEQEGRKQREETVKTRAGVKFVRALALASGGHVPAGPQTRRRRRPTGALQPEAPARSSETPHSRLRGSELLTRRVTLTASGVGRGCGHVNTPGSCWRIYDSLPFLLILQKLCS